MTSVQRHTLRAIAAAIGMLALCASPLRAQDDKLVRTEIGAEEAWMGQDVRLILTLISPGPFSGTARFDLPEIPDTLIVYLGSPLVGSETIDGESMITQRHEFSIYTQQVGVVELPAFSIDFDSKETFTGDPVPRSAKTTAVSFNSKRPPGTEALPFVVSSATLTVEESWSPPDQTQFAAGDILSRSITRNASDVSAMFLAPFQSQPIDGVRIYPSEPEVIDKRERGVAVARRTDTLKYQFERGGTFIIPDIVYTWWDPKKQELQQVTLEGITLSATAPPVPPKPVDKKKIAIAALLLLALLLLAWGYLLPLLRKRYAAWHARRHSPEAEATRALIRACRHNEPRQAFTSLTTWKRCQGQGARFSTSIDEAGDALTRQLYQQDTASESWDGQPLLSAFRQELKQRKRQPQDRPKANALPPLNPASGQTSRPVVQAPEA